MVCALCGSENVRGKVYEVRWPWPDPHGGSMCVDCGLYFLDEAPTDQEIRAFYNQPHFYQYGRIKGKVKDLFREFRSRSQHRYVCDHMEVAGLRILEVGAGDGLFLGMFKGAADLIGLEFNPPGREMAREKYGVELFDADFFGLDERVDLLLMSHTIEHFPNLEEVMVKSRDILRNNGHFFIEVPCSPKQDECDVETFQAYFQSSHIFDFSVESVSGLGKPFGFEVVSLERYFYNLPLSGSGDARRTIGKALLEGQIVPLKYAPSAGLFFLRSLLFRSSAYAQIPLHDPWWGPGDSIRAILRKT